MLSLHSFVLISESRSLLAMGDDGSVGDIGLQAIDDSFRGRFPVAACEILVYVDGNDDTYLLLGKYAFASFAESMRQVGVADIRLADPDTIPQNNAVLAAVYCGKFAMTPFVIGLIRDQAHIGHRIKRHIEAHEVDKIYPCRQIFFVAQKNSCRGRAGSPFARTAPETS